MAQRLITAPAAELLTADEARTHLRVTGNDDDTIIGSFIAVARQHCEEFTGRAFINQTWQVTLDAFPDRDDRPIELPRPPLSSVTHVKYYDAAGTQQTWSAADYIADGESVPARIVPAYAVSWPVIQPRANAVEIRYVAGYGAASTAVPPAITAAVRFMLGFLYENREGVIVGAASAGAVPLPEAVQRLLWPFVVRW